jgi:hypothetical protein
MPAKSQKQQKFMGIELAKKKAGKKTKTGVNIQQLTDFAATPRKGLPKKAPKKK